jgi:hypothetical protein
MEETMKKLVMMVFLAVLGLGLVFAGAGGEKGGSTAIIM